MEQSVPKRRHIKFRRRGITQKKAYNISNTFWLKWTIIREAKYKTTMIALPAPNPHGLNPWTCKRLLLWSTKLHKYKLIKIYKTTKNVLTGVYRLLKWL